MALAFNPGTQEANWVEGQLGLRSKFQDSQNYIVRPHLKKRGGATSSVCSYHQNEGDLQW